MDLPPEQPEEQDETMSSHSSFFSNAPYHPKENTGPKRTKTNTYYKQKTRNQIRTISDVFIEYPPDSKYKVPGYVHVLPSCQKQIKSCITRAFEAGAIASITTTHHGNVKLYTYQECTEEVIQECTEAIYEIMFEKQHITCFGWGYTLYESTNHAFLLDYNNNGTRISTTRAPVRTPERGLLKRTHPSPDKSGNTGPLNSKFSRNIEGEIN